MQPMSAASTSRHFAAAQQFGRIWSEAVKHTYRRPCDSARRVADVAVTGCATRGKRSEVIDESDGHWARTSGAFAHRPDAGRGRLEALVDRHVAVRAELYPGEFESDPLRVRRAAGCDEHVRTALLGCPGAAPGRAGPPSECSCCPPRANRWHESWAGRGQS
jgi:hypothetical protein